MRFSFPLLISLFLGIAGLVMLSSPVSVAQDSEPPIGLMPAKTVSLDNEISSTHPILRLTPEKSEIVRLERDAASVIVGNPSHVSVLLDTPRILVLVPKASGATHFTVLDLAGKIVMQRHVVVASPKERYIRIRRSCANAGDDAECLNTSIYFCPDICHDVATSQIGEEIEQQETPEEVPTAPLGEFLPERF